MNKTFFSILMVASMLMTACASTRNVVKADVSPAEQLKQNLLKWQQKGYLFGHQDDPVYGTTWKWDYDRSDTKAVCGDYPALMGFDLGKIELGSDVNLDGVPFNRMREEIINQYNRGGVVTISWHPYNPVTGSNAWDTGGDAVKAVLAGGAQYEKFQSWLSVVAKFLNSLVTPDGRKIPVIFRPWHEMSGSWFWWGAKSCTEDEYKQLYRMTVDYMRGHQLNNLLYAFSPNMESNDTESHFMKFYPGDEYIDIVGVDIYQFDSTGAEYTKNMTNELTILTKIGKDHKKIICVAETGYRNTPYAKWFTEVLKPAIDKFPIAYVLLWRNAWDKPEENFGPAPEKSCAADFVQFYKAKNTLFVNDIK